VAGKQNTGFISRRATKIRLVKRFVFNLILRHFQKLQLITLPVSCPESKVRMQRGRGAIIWEFLLQICYSFEKKAAVESYSIKDNLVNDLIDEVKVCKKNINEQ